MARPQKTGLNYFPLDVDYFDDDKVALVSAELGTPAELIFLRLLCKIYKNGYYCEWSEDTKLIMARKLGASNCLEEAGYIQKVVDALLKRDLFDMETYKTSNVLTSKAIQKRFKEATVKRKNQNLDRPYWLLPLTPTPKIEENPQDNGVNDDNNGVNDGINGVNDGINTHSRVDNSIVDNSTLNNTTLNNNKVIYSISREKEDLEILKIFFFNKKIKEPQKELERFRSHYESTGWVNARGIKITNKIALARNWDVKDALKINALFTEKWKPIFDLCSDKKMLTDVYGYQLIGDTLKITCTRDFAKFFDKKAGALRPTLEQNFECKHLKYVLNNNK